MLRMEEILRIEMIHAPRTLLFDVWFTTTEFMLRSKKCEGAGWNGFFEWNDIE